MFKLEQVIPKVNSSGWISIPCPFCTEDFRHARHYHLHISPDLSFAHCFRCKWNGTVAELLDYIDIDLSSIDKNRIMIKENTRLGNVGKKFPVTKSGVFKEYLAKRKALKIAIQEGWWIDIRKFSVVIPIYNLLGEELRIHRFIKNPYRRYHVEGQLGRFLYNYSMKFKGKTIILCEGVFDCVAVREAGWQNCIASLGNRLTKFQVNLLELLSPSKIYVLYDAVNKDPYIKRAVKKVMEQLESFCEVWYLSLPDGDPNSYPYLKEFLEEEKVERCI